MPRKHPPPNSDAVLERLKALHPRMIDLSLGRIRRLLAALGHPERALPPVIHVAGTNGKGSVIAFMAAIAGAAGLKAHVYTSPHLVRFAERIRPAGRIIGEARLAALLAECEAANAGKPITFFEITTAAALLAFARTPADLTLLETGLGGRLDATNVVRRPAVTVITPVALDHQRFLGRTLAAIAGEKAGILKRRVPAVIGPQHPFAARVLAARAGALEAPLIRWGREFEAETKAGALIYRDGERTLELPAPALAGPHQAANAAMAIAAVKALGDSCPGGGAIAKGLKRARWPARLQRLEKGPIGAPLAARGFEVLLDGGHNPAAARALARALEGDPRPLYLVVGMVGSKDVGGFVEPLVRLGPKGLWAVPVPGDHPGSRPGRIAATAGRLGIPAYEAPSAETAAAVIARRKPGRVLITGSLYLAGNVLREAKGP